MVQRFGVILLIVIAALWARNASVFADVDPNITPRLLSHRGVHQTFDHANLTKQDCTAERIFPPTHEFLENTLPSMATAFDHGADVVELDIHPTPDGVFAVFHDWTLDCRTEGTGETGKTDMAILKTLDIGYGYTADAGKTYPFRGAGVGMMPSLQEVLAQFPDRQFLVNFKSNRTRDGEALASFIAQNPMYNDHIWAVYGGAKPTQAYLAQYPEHRGFSRPSTKACLKDYVLTGWIGRVPKSCQNTIVSVPISHTGLVWGWPHAFTARMRAAGSEVVLLGPYKKSDGGSTGIDDAALWAQVPSHFDGYVWTNQIEKIGPLAQSN